MNFMKAVWYLTSRGATVTPSDMVGSGGRFYKLDNKNPGMSPMFCSQKVLTDIANNLKEKEEDEYPTTYI